MTTKEKIIHTAVHVFNKEGLEQTSIRKIAERMGIAHGNLRYHYPTKEAIVNQIFLNMKHVIDLAFASILTDGISLKSVMKANEMCALEFVKYRFFMNDFISIARLYPSVKKGLKDNYDARNIQMREMLQIFIHANLLKPEPFEGLFDLILENIYITNDFWIPSFEIYGAGNIEQNVERYCNQWAINFYPYLTEKGRKELEEYSDFWKKR